MRQETEALVLRQPISAMLEPVIPTAPVRTQPY
jgi:hypothetical protein